MKKLQIIFVLLFLTIYSYGQLGNLYSIGYDVSKSLSRNKKKDSQPVFNKILIADDSVVIMRIDSAKIQSPAKKYIILIQQDLDLAMINCTNKKHITLGDFGIHYIQIQNSDPDWEVVYYERESSAYNKYEYNLQTKEAEAKRIEDARIDRENDSLFVIREKRYKEIAESVSLVARNQLRAADSIALVKQLAENKQIRDQEAAQAKRDAIATTEKKKVRRESLIKKYGEELGMKIFNGGVSIGMTKEMCIEAWGKPQDINRTSNAYGVHEQWVYNMKSFLYFNNGILYSFQN